MVPPLSPGVSVLLPLLLMIVKLVRLVLDVLDVAVLVLLCLVCVDFKRDVAARRLTWSRIKP